jgi:hypothetical protein
LNSNGTENGSGNGADRDTTHVDRLVLTLQRYPWRLEVGGHCENDDVAVAMLQQALRVYEVRLRAANALDIARQMEQARRDEKIARELAGRR